MPRIASLSPRFCARRRDLEITGETGKAVAKCIGALTRDPLPTAQDAEALMPPVSRYWFRRVQDYNLWIWFSFDDARVYIVSLTARPPVPIDHPL